MTDTAIRDRLAKERTELAQERTYLSYIRTGMTVLLGGIFFIGYFNEDSWFYAIGWATIMLSVLFLTYGFYKHEQSKQFIIKIFGLQKD
ncbi:MAG: DUF202 domain-containing protein [Candidatus Micrarchaeota archaeon]